MKRFLKHPLILSFLIISGLALFYSQGYLEPLEDIFLKVLTPVSRLIYQSSSKARNLAQIIKRQNTLSQENSRLEQDNQELLSQLFRLKELEEENEFLRQQLELASSSDPELILAEIISYNSSNLEKSFLIGSP